MNTYLNTQLQESLYIVQIILADAFLYQHHTNRNFSMQLKQTLCGIYLLLYLLKKVIRNATTTRNISTAVTTPTINPEFAGRDVKLMGDTAKITEMDWVTGDVTVDLRM